MESSFIILLFMTIICICLGPVESKAPTKSFCKQFKMKSISARSCEFYHVCYDGASWLQADPQTSTGQAEEINLGTYTSSPVIKFQPTAGSLLWNASAAHQQSTIFYYAANPRYFHWLMDDLLGLWWLNTFWRPAHPLSLLLHPDYNRLPPAFLQQAATLLDNATLLPSPTLLAGANPAAPLCFRRLVVGPAAHHFGGPGQYKAHEKIADFALDFYSSHGVQIERKAPHRIVILQRTHDRRLLNAEQIAELFRARFPGFTVSVMSLEDLDFKKQLLILRETFILVGVHGSGLANTLFLPPISLLVELFPFGFDRQSFGELAHVLGTPYYPYRPTREEAIFNPKYLEKMTPAERKRATEAKAYDSEMGWQANLYWINQDLRVDMEKFTEFIDENVVPRPRGEKVEQSGRDDL